MKNNNDFVDAAILYGEPLKGYAPEDIRKRLFSDSSDTNLADCLAAVHNKTGCLSHEVDDPDNDEDTNNSVIEKFEMWWTLEQELVAEVIQRLEKENETHSTKYVTSGIGYYYIVKPFMEQNGYRDGAGWWVKDE